MLGSIMALSLILGGQELSQGFEKPVRLTVRGTAISAEGGYAAPCMADVNGDGNPELLVWQFNGGRIRCYGVTGKFVLSEGDWIQAGGKTAIIPGIW